MGVRDFSADDEDQLFKELLQWDNQRYADQQVAGEDLADKVDWLTTQAPYANADLIMSAAEGWRAGELDEESAFALIDEATKVDVQQTVQEAEETGGWRNTAYDWLKKGTKWGFAGLELVPQLFTNAVVRGGQELFGGPGSAFPGQTDPNTWYDKPTSEGFFDGWFASTDLGGLLSGEASGNGFWIGDKAKERQLEAVKAYRGQYAGEAITIGRGFAGTFLTPNSKPYNFLSGIVDGAAAIALPSLPGASLAGKGVTSASRAAGIGSMAGLTNFAEPFIDFKRANQWLDTKSGTKIAERISKINTIEEAMEVFPKVTNDFWDNIVSAQTVDEVKNMLRSNIGAPNPARRQLGDWQPDQKGLGIREGLQDVRDINLGAVAPIRGGVRRALARSRNYERLTAPVPGRELAIDIQNLNNPYATGRILTQTVTNARDYMKLVKMDPVKRNEVLQELSSALSQGNRAAARQVITKMTDEIIDSMATHQGVMRRYEKDFLKQMFTKYQGDVEEFQLYGFIDDAGKPIVLDDLVAAAADGAELPDGVRLVMDTAGLTSEVQKLSTFLPDPRRLRRVTTQFAPLWAKAMSDPKLYGDPQMWTVATEFVMNKVFRTAMLLTGGYTLRNMLESSLRQLATPGINAGPASPLEWIMSMMRYKHKGTIEGEAFTQAGARLAREGLAEYEKATGAIVREAQLDPSFAEQLSFRNGVYSIAIKGTKNQDYVRGVATELRLLANDEVARQLAGDASIDEVLAWLTSDRGSRYVDQISSMWSNRLLQDAQGNEFRGNILFRRTNQQTGQVEFVEQNLRKYVEQVKRRLDVKTGGHQSLREVVANALQDGEFFDAAGNATRAFKEGRYVGAAVDEWERFDYTDEFFAEIRRILDDDTNMLPEHVKYTKPLELDVENKAPGAEFIRQRVRHFFTYTFGKKEAFLNRSPVFRQFYYKKLSDLVDGNALTREAYDTAYRNVVEAALKQPEDELKLLRSVRPDPVNGKYMWNGFPIRKVEYDLRVKRAEAAVKSAKKNVRRNADGSYTLLDSDWAARYVGSKDLWKKIVDGRNGLRAAPMDGLSAEYASFVSKAFAMEETQKAFFNATQTSNFTDIMRIAVPFGAAWKEAMAYNVKQLALKPDRLRKIEQTVRSARDSDPDNDGKGFFYTDPTTGEMMFNYPFGLDIMPVMVAYGLGTAVQTLVRGRGASFVGGALAGAALGGAGSEYVKDTLEGLPTPGLVAPAKSLNQSLQVFPGFGPVVQFPAGLLLRDRPEYQDILEVVAPMGGFTSISDAIVPKWAQRLAAAIRADSENDRFFSDIFIDVGRALYNSGEYDASNPDDMLLLRQRATRSAQTLLALRALGQFTGPARPEVDLKVPTKFEGTITINDVESFVSGNISTSLLSATFRAMQEEDYDNAVQNFIRTFGPNATWFIPGLTSTEVEGLQATDQFGEWELDNGDVVSKYPKVYGYFAPVGGEFDFQTYLRQLSTGKRTRTSSIQDVQRDAESVVGRALYMDAVRMAGPEIDPMERASLRAYREQLKTNYPGYGTIPIDLNENYTIMSTLQKMAGDQQLAGNPVWEGMVLYFNAREQALAVANTRGGTPSQEALTRAANGDLRQYLRGVGNDIMSQFPEFGRLYSRVLFDEIDEYNARN
jgi:hypothetical protein